MRIKTSRICYHIMVSPEVLRTDIITLYREVFI